MIYGTLSFPDTPGQEGRIILCRKEKSWEFLLDGDWDPGDHVPHTKDFLEEGLETLEASKDERLIKNGVCAQIITEEEAHMLLFENGDPTKS